MVSARHLGEVERQRRQHDRPGGRVEHGAQRVADHRRLLVDLLQHEVAEVALADQRAGGGDRLHRPGDRSVLRRRRSRRPRGRSPPSRLRRDSRCGRSRAPSASASEPTYISPSPKPIARGEPRRATDHQVLLAGEQERQREGALQPLQRRGAGLARRHLPVEIMADQMRDGLGVGLGVEDLAEPFQLLPQLAEVLDDAVVHDRDPVGRVRMGVALGRPAVGGPAGVADADGAGDRRLAEAGLEVDELALGAAALDPAVDQGGDAGGVIAAIFQALQRLDQAGRDRPGRR